MATAGKAKTKLVNGQRVSIDTGLPYDGSVAPANTIKADQLPAVPSPYTTFFPTPTADIGLAESATAVKDSVMANIAKEVEVQKATQKDQTKEAEGIFSKLASLTGLRSSENERLGVNTEQEEVDKLTSEMEAVGRSYDKRIAAIEEKNVEGLFGGGADVEISRLRRQKASELADIGIALTARTRNLTRLQSLVDEKVTAETEALQIQLQGLQFFYNANDSKLTENQRTLLQSKINDAENELADEKDLRKQIAQLQASAAGNYAPVSVIRAIGKASSVEDAIVAGGNYLATPRAADKGFDVYTDEDQRNLFQANLTNASERVKQIFLNTDLEFQREYVRSGKGTSDTSPEQLIADYDKWEKENSDSGGNVEDLINTLRSGG